MISVSTPSSVCSAAMPASQSITILRGSVKLLTADIVRLEGERNYTRFVLRGGRYILTSKNLSYYTELLPETFVRIRKGCLVNRLHVRKFAWNEVVLLDGTKLPIARRKRRKVQNNL